jgi:hypothetical protein
MPRRYEAPSGATLSFPMRLGSALRASLRHGYSAKGLRSDLLAGVVVGIVALPLSMALDAPGRADLRGGGPLFFGAAQKALAVARERSAMAAGRMAAARLEEAGA